MKVGIMGGTFDPIHLGHLIAAESAREGLQLDEVWFIPSHIPPHKGLGPKANAEQRWEMVSQSLENCPHFRPIDLEMKRGGTSYTIDTAAELNRLYPQHDFYYIIGADMVQYLPQWYRVDELLNWVSFIGLERAGFDLQWEELPKAIQDKVTMIPMPMIEISSTDIRERLAGGKSIRYLVPENILHYIEVNRLYES
jgi:nicotinate-nucleotide adenylyltransferase